MADEPKNALTISIQEYESEATKNRWLGIILLCVGIGIYVSIIYTILITIAWQLNHPPAEGVSCRDYGSLWLVIIGAVIALVLVIAFAIYLSKFTQHFFDRAQYFKRKKLILQFVNEMGLPAGKDIGEIIEALKRLQEVY